MFCVLEERHGIDYQHELISGIEEQWSGSIDGINIRTNVILISEEMFPIYDSAVKVYLCNAKGCDDYPNAVGNCIYMYDRDGRSSLTPYSIDAFRSVVAHELGHAAFYIGDFYNKPEYKKLKSLMKNYKTGTQPVDFELMLNSYWFSKTTAYKGLSTNEIVSKYLD